VSAVYMDMASYQTLDAAGVKRLIDRHMLVDEGKYRQLQEYYLGNHSILHSHKEHSASPNNRIVCNVAKYITDTATGYFLGQPVVYGCPNDQYLAQLQDIMDYNDEQDHNAELAKGCSIKGSCCEMLYLDEDAAIRIALLEPDDCLVIYPTGSEEPMGAIRRIVTEDKDGNRITRYEWWREDDVWYFSAPDGGSLQLSGTEDHYWHGVPVVEYRNNDERMGDYESVIPMIDAYNRVQSNTANMYQYNDDAIMVLSHMGAATSNDIVQIKEEGAISLANGGKIDWLLKDINDAGLEHYKDRLTRDIHALCGVPRLSDEQFAGNLSGVAISYKLWGLEQVTAIKERKFKRSLQRRAELITNILHITSNPAYDYRDISIQFRRNQPQNLPELAEVVTKLAADLSRETRLKLLPVVNNVQDEIDKLKAEEDEQLKAAAPTTGYEALAKALREANEPPAEGAEDGDSA
jgi:SPP1 family phage portal protein